MIKEKILKYSEIAFFIIYALFSVGLLLTPLKYNHSIKMISLYISIALVILLIFKFKNKLSKKYLNIIFIVCISIGIILRIALVLFLNYNETPTGADYQTFWYNASSWCNANSIGSKTYVELFPFLIPYMVILGSFLKLAKVSYQSIVILNVILDLLTVVSLWFIFKNKNISKCITAMWLISPINLVWSLVCCPVVLVNFGISLSILIFTLLFKNIKSKKFIIYSILTGIIIGISNAFRPIMIIMIIAIALYYIYMILKENKYKKNYIISFIIIVLSFSTVKYLTMSLLDNIIDGSVSRTSGWNFYIGSNLESNGMWYAEPKLYGFLDEGFTAEETQQKFKELAIERYKNNGIKNLKLFIEKFFIITGQVAEYTYGTVFEAFSLQNNSILTMLKIVIYSYNILIIYLNLLMVIKDFKDKKFKKEYIFYMLFYIGIVMAHLFVEVSPRYYMPAIVPLTIISGISIFKNFSNKSMEE